MPGLLIRDLPEEVHRKLKERAARNRRSLAKEALVILETALGGASGIEGSQLQNLIKYQTMVRQFEAKYGYDFEIFREKVLESEPTFEVEQDYFDWELAVTGITDMKEEIERLKGHG